MKKVFFTIAIVAVITTMVSCGSKTIQVASIIMKASAISAILRWIMPINMSKATICYAMARISNTSPLPSRMTAPRRN